MAFVSLCLGLDDCVGPEPSAAAWLLCRPECRIQHRDQRGGIRRRETEHRRRKLDAGQSSYPRAELEKHNGQYVAWSPDGTRILAAHADPLQLDAVLCTAGYDPAEILVSLVAVPEEVSWCGWLLPEDSPQS